MFEHREMDNRDVLLNRKTGLQKVVINISIHLKEKLVFLKYFLYIKSSIKKDSKDSKQRNNDFNLRPSVGAVWVGALLLRFQDGDGGCLRLLGGGEAHP